MRIRSIRPEFWSSEDVAALDWPTRLLFIGLWSYVDDNGVGRDVEKLIAADLFPLEDDPRETLATVSRGLQQLSDGGQITRYKVDGKTYLHVTAWDEHQRVERPGKPRYPLPTCGNTDAPESVPTPSRHSPDTLPTGEGEKGRRGEGEKTPRAPRSTNLDTDPDFVAFWSAFPRKEGRGDTKRAWPRALKKATAGDLILAAKAFAERMTATGVERQFVKTPAAWLNAERWADEPDQATSRPRAARMGVEGW